MLSQKTNFIGKATASQHSFIPVCAGCSVAAMVIDMKIEKLRFEKTEIEISETYVDLDGKIKERTRRVTAPTGRCLNDNTDSEDKSKD